MRKGKGEAEPATLRGGQPPAQPSDTRLGSASGAGAQDSGLQSAEQSLQENVDAEEILVWRMPVGTWLCRAGFSPWQPGFLSGPEGGRILGWIGETEPGALQERKCLLPTFPQLPTQNIPQGIPQTAQRRLIQQR